jgi:hypothetical protein
MPCRLRHPTRAQEDFYQATSSTDFLAGTYFSVIAEE